ncbi:UNVERIFIED_CONTAM: hypothetical protein GTU68_002738 [Idotea baltica]|nr:hypothetical protein [Idotea baltica]
MIEKSITGILNPKMF